MTPRATIRRAHALRLAGYSCLILFIELALIRYIAAYVRVFGFFVNFVLIATFLGMGVGLLAERRRQTAQLVAHWLAPVALVVLFAVVKLFSVLGIHVVERTDEALWAIVPHAEREIGIVPAVIILFALTAILFIPLGIGLAREFRRFPALKAYSLDIAGSLVGVLAFGAMSWAQTPPLVWFSLAFAGWLLLTIGGGSGRRAARPLGLAMAGALALIVATSTTAERWSPYYRITEDREPHTGLQCIYVNGMLHQCMVDFAHNQPLAAAYLWPYRFVDHLDTALIVGAGSGNDVSVLLHKGAQYIDAVEIDPVIQSIGASQHPLNPYADPRVHVHLTDARAFLRTTQHHYNVVVMGTLDSQTLLSGMSSVRLDNYVYTRESFAAARDRLAPGGSFIAYHMSMLPPIESKVYQLAADAFHAWPRSDTTFKHLFNLTLVAGAGAGERTADSVPAILRLNVGLPTDDWPYLYLTRPSVPVHYILALGGVLAVAAMLILLTVRFVNARPAARSSLSPRDAALFGTGLGFLLLESKSVTEMSLLFGATWTVNLLVFAAILTVIGIANFLVARLTKAALPGLFAALLATLTVAYCVPVHALLGFAVAVQWAIGATLVALPIFFAALIFGILIRDHPEPTRGLAINLMGAIIGGVLEYTAMAVGIKALYLIAAAAYVATFVAAILWDRLTVAVPSTGGERAAVAAD